MKLSNFKFDLPENLIAKKPSHFRDESRLMVLHKKTGEIEHVIFKDILRYFEKSDCFVFNNTKVFPARLYGSKEKTRAQIEVFLLRELNEGLKLWDVLVDPARKIRIGNKLYFGKDDSLVAEVIDNTTSRGRTLRFLYDGDHEEFKKILFDLGETPIPKYLDRKPNSDDIDRYQTLFASQEGAVVAPAAGLHFSRELLKRMEIYDIDKAFVTIHNSLGILKDIDVEDLTKHKLESEQMIVDTTACDLINNCKEREKKICAVGTATLRALETASGTNNRIKEFEGWTNKFIFPPYDIQIADALVSNFQMPKSTLLMVTAAFGGYENVMNAYNVAVKEKYHFGDYGDALLII